MTKLQLFPTADRNGKGMSMRPAVFLIAIAVALSLASCSLGQRSPAPNLEKTIIGTWREVSGPTTMEFFREGSVIIAGRGRATTAYYEFVEEDTLKIESKFRSKDNKSDTKVVKVSITRDQLTLRDAAGATIFQRQK
ncbi:MAG: hypothetical protein HYY46_04280 [Deltaproteobacteria bacterium]|nr:hypothetical protein [Deltaproteobacteria bacterium]